MTATQGALASREEIRRRIDAVLAREEFGQEKSGIAEWVEERFSDLSDWFGDLLGIPEPAVARSVLTALLVLLAAAIAVAIGALVSRRLRARGEESAAASSLPDSARRAASVAALRRAGRAAADRGDHVAALRLYFRALVLGLSERGDLDYRDAWTNRELFERGAPRRELAPLLLALVPRLDAQSFGREPAGQDDVERLASLCDRLLGRRSA